MSLPNYKLSSQQYQVEDIDAFVDLMRPLGLVEVSRTGVLSIHRGAEKN